MDHNILSLFQLCDSNFPTGAFSHSYGLESYIQEDHVHDQATFSQWLHVYLNEQLVYSDGLASRLVYEALENGRCEKVWKVDRMLTVQNLPRETREGYTENGRTHVESRGISLSDPVLTQYRKRIKEKKSFGHPAIVFTMIGHHLGVPQINHDSLLFILYRFKSCSKCGTSDSFRTNSRTKNHSGVSRCFSQATEKIQDLDEEDFGIISPGLELSQMKHERVNIRIFMS